MNIKAMQKGRMRMRMRKLRFLLVNWILKIRLRVFTL